jgi:hypothetical protein
VRKLREQIRYNKTNIKRNILTIKQIHREVGRAKDLSAPLYMSQSIEEETQVLEQSVCVLHAYLSEKTSLEISIRGHTDRRLMLIQR